MQQAAGHQSQQQEQQTHHHHRQHHHHQQQQPRPQQQQQQQAASEAAIQACSVATVDCATPAVTPPTTDVEGVHLQSAPVAATLAAPEAGSLVKQPHGVATPEEALCRMADSPLTVLNDLSQLLNMVGRCETAQSLHALFQKLRTDTNFACIVTCKGAKGCTLSF